MSNITKLSDKVLNERLKVADDELATIRDRYAEIQHQCSIAYEKYKELFEESERRKIANGMLTVSDYLNGNNESQAMYNAYNIFLLEKGLTPGGTWLYTGQRVIGVAFKRNDPNLTAKQIQSLKELLPYITPITAGKDLYERSVDEEIVGCKPIDITESTLSEFGSYKIYVRPDNTVLLAYTRYSITTYKELGDFDTAMMYIAKHHYYE